MMTTYSILPPDNFISMPWKNGLSHTVEILKHTRDEEEAFAWCLSMADVTTDGEGITLTKQ
jgi:environmental stress-induced protein Ves